jgi:hypothetical protein
MLLAVAVAFPRTINLPEHRDGRRCRGWMRQHVQDACKSAGVTDEAHASSLCEARARSHYRESFYYESKIRGGPSMLPAKSDGVCLCDR